MVTKTPTIERVHAKLLELQAMHDNIGNQHRSFGLDTMSLIFNTSYNVMHSILEQMKNLELVTYAARTPDPIPGKRGPAKIPVWFVSLN